MCEVYGFCGSKPEKLNQYTNEFWLHSRVHQDGFGYYIADHDELYVNKDQALKQIKMLNKKDFTAKLALCHIRFKTHGCAKVQNCHPFCKKDVHGILWTLIHNGYIMDNTVTSALSHYQIGETDSERILLAIVEAVNELYEHTWITDWDEMLYYMYIQIENVLLQLSSLGKTNLIFTDNLTNNMYVFMNSPNTLFYLNDGNGYHVATVPLSDEKWKPVEPHKLHIINNGCLVDF